MWDLKYDMNERIYEQKQIQVQKRRGEKGRTGSLGLADANYYIQDG